MRTLLLSMFVLLCGTTGFAQLSLTENFDASTSLPTGWSDDGNFTIDIEASRSCSGNSWSDNLYSGNTTSFLQSPAATGATADEVTITFDYKVVNWNSSTTTPAAGWGSFTLSYAINGGAFTPTGATISTAELNCTAFTTTIPAGTLTVGDDVTFQIDAVRTAGDWDLFIDNFSATQPGACMPGAATFAVVDDCAASGNFNVTVDVTAVGTATLISFADDQGGAAQSGIVSDLLTFGPYASGTEVIITGTPDDNASCAITSSALTFECPAPGDICDLALPITSLPYTTTDDTGNYGDDVSGSPGSSGCGTTSSYLNGDDVFYTFTPTNTGDYTITLDPDDTWSGIFVYADCADVGTGCIAGAGSSSSADREFIVSLESGEDYFIVISTFASPQTVGYTFTLTENTCSEASATFGVDSDCDAGGSGGFFTEIAITDFGSATTLVATNDQDATTLTLNAGSPSGLFGPFNNGDDVIITLTPDDDASCTILSSVLTQDACPPANDECDDATALTIGTGADGTITNATDSGEDNCFGTPDDDVWYSFEATSTTHFVDLMSRNGTSSFYDFYHAVYSGDCAALTNVTCSDGNSSTTTGLTIGDTYYVQVFSYTSTANQVADFSISVTAPAPPPANDDCADAIALTDANGTPTAASGAAYNSSSGTPSGVADPECGGFTGDNPDDDIWFTVTAPGGAGDIITIIADDIDGLPSVDLVIALYSGECGSLVQVDCADGSNPETITYTIPEARQDGSSILAEETYLVRVFQYGSGGGNFTVSAVVQSILPVELTAFTGQTMEKANKLSWATASEDAASHYVVERAATGTTTWVAIAEVSAAGYATTESTYELMDEQPLTSALYRLRMVDLDGSTEFSNIVRLDNGTALTDRLTVTPNPTFGDVSLSFVAEAAGQANVILTDLTGRTVSQRTISVTEGLQTQTVSLADVAGGIYLVQVAVDGRQYVKRVVRR